MPEFYPRCILIEPATTARQKIQVKQTQGNGWGRETGVESNDKWSAKVFKDENPVPNLNLLLFGDKQNISTQ